MSVMRLWMLITVVVLVLSACTGNEPGPTELPEVTALPSVTPEQTAEAIADTPIERGRMLFTSFIPQAGFSCATCHYTTSQRRLIGPGLAQVASRVDSYSLEIDAETYLRAAIAAPDAFLTPADPPYPAGVMPQVYGSLLTPEQMNDLVAFLLSL